MSNVFFALLTLLAWNCFSDVNTLPSDLLDGVGFSSQQRDDLIGYHNYYRRKFIASNMAELQWDPELAGMAQSHADLCSNYHGENVEVYGKRAEYDGGLVGENIWGGTNDKLNMDSVANVWFEEGKEHGCDQNGWQCCNGKCTHFSQVVWAKSKKLGCGLAKCSMLDSWAARGFPRDHYIFKYYHLISLVCYYSPGGNYKHEKIFEPADKINPWCSHCEGTEGVDFTCETRLCRYKN